MHGCKESVLQLQVGFFILCSLQAAKHSLTYPDFAWIMYSTYPLRETADDHNNCTDETIMKFLSMSRVIAISILPESERDDVQTNTGFVSFVNVSLTDDMVT